MNSETRRRGWMKRLLAVGVIAVMPLGCGGPDPEEAATPLEDGVYAVTAAGESRDELRPAGPGEALLVESRKYVQGGAEEPPSYVLIDTESFVPLRLRSDPEKATGADGREQILISLEESATARLQDFTREVAGRQGQVVVVLGGEVVTRHKVREPITGGSFAISC